MSAIYKNGIAYGGAASTANLISATGGDGTATNVQAQLDTINENIVIGDLIQATDLSDFFKKALNKIDDAIAPRRMGGSAAMGWSGHQYYIFSFARYGTNSLLAKVSVSSTTESDYALYYRRESQNLQIYERPPQQTLIITQVSSQYTVSNTNKIDIDNPAPSGYQFLCHTQVITSGFSAGVTFANPSRHTTLWFDKTVATGTVRVVSLFKKI